MWMTFAIAGTLFVAMLAILWFGYRQIEEREERSQTVPQNEAVGRPGHCLLCDAPVRRVSSTDEALCEVEHRIDADRAEIVLALRAELDERPRTRAQA